MDTYRLKAAAVCAGLAGAFAVASEVVKRRRQAAEAKRPWQYDVRSGLTKVEGLKPKKWAFLSCGRVAHDMANALKCVEGAELHVVAVRSAGDLSRAERFRDAHGFRGAVGSYAEALADEAVDVVYLSAMHSSRVEHVTQILDAGKHCLVEKPLACSVEDGKRLVALARRKGLFMMEGMWTRCFPAVEKARELLDGGAVGAVTAVISDFGFDAADSGAYPSAPGDARSGDPIYHKALGGGALLWAGPYPVAAGLLPFGAAEPHSCSAAGVVDDFTGVDLSCSLALSYDAPGGAYDPDTARDGACPPRGATVSLYTSIDAETAETTAYVGQKGRITVLPPAHCPTRLKVELKGTGRGEAKATYHDFPFPEPKRPFVKCPGSDKNLFYYPNSHGFCYEAAAVMRCLNAGLTECPQYTLDETLRALYLIDFAKKSMNARRSS